MNTDAIITMLGRGESEQLLTLVGADDQRGLSDQGVTFWRNGIVRTLASVALIQNTVSWAILFFSVSHLRESVVLHYNVFLGVDMTGTYRDLYFGPIVGLLFWSVNLSLARFLYTNQERIAAYMLLLAGIMIEFGVVIAAISLALVNY